MAIIIVNNDSHLVLLKIYYHYISSLEEINMEDTEDESNYSPIFNECSSYSAGLIIYIKVRKLWKPKIEYLKKCLMKMKEGNCPSLN